MMMQVLHGYADRLPRASEAKKGETTREEYEAWYGEAVEEVNSGVAVILRKIFELVARKVG